MKTIDEEEDLGTAPKAARWFTIGLIVIAVAAVTVAFIGQRQGWIDVAAIAKWVRSVGGTWWAPLAFVGLFAVFNVLALPGTILTITAGIVWGWVLGGTYAWIGGLIGNLVPYYLARRGAPWIEEAVLSGRRRQKILERLRRQGFTSLLVMRLIPLIPYNVLNYASGFADIAFRDYFFATAIGRAPGSYIYAFFADAITSHLMSQQGAMVRILIAGAILVALVLTTQFLARRWRQREKLDE